MSRVPEDICVTSIYLLGDEYRAVVRYGRRNVVMGGSTRGRRPARQMDSGRPIGFEGACLVRVKVAAAWASVRAEMRSRRKEA
jgi:hypothetical protein